MKAIQACELSDGVNETSQLEIKQAVRKLRFQQLILVLFAPSSAMLWILTAARLVLPFYWYVSII